MANRLRWCSHRACLNLDCRADLIWWEVFVQDWNGVGLFPSLPQGHTIISDALGSWGCGAYCQETSQWLQLNRLQSWASINIAVKELLPIFLCAAIWGLQWHGSTVLFYCNNEAVVSRLSSLSAREPYMRHLLCCLFFFEARFRFEHRARHIAGKLNTAADAISCNFSLCPQAPLHPTPIQKVLTDFLMDSSITWTSPHWRALFGDILQAVLHPEPDLHTLQPSTDI